jgi:hypothetical protein
MSAIWGSDPDMPNRIQGYRAVKERDRAIQVKILKSLSPETGPSIPAHVLSKLVLVTFHPLTKAKETFYNSNLKYLQFSMALLRNVNGVNSKFYTFALLIAQCVEL